MPSPHAVPRTRTTPGPAALTCGSRAIAELGGLTSTGGPEKLGKGSIRASALRIDPEGGSASLSCRRTAERWTARRTSGSCELWRATAPPIQAMPSATHAVSAAPSAPSRMSSARRSHAPA